MPRSNSALPRFWLCELALAIAVTWCGLANSAAAQIGGTGGIPSVTYFAILPNYYDGDYRTATGGFLSESRGGMKTTNGPWIDAICSLTMAGESQYQLGQMPAALANYDAALHIFTAYSDWMMRMQFPAAIGPAGPPRATPWGQSKRGAPIGGFTETYPMGQGMVDNSQVVRQGGVLQQAVIFPVHAAEVVRATSLAIRRRREILGPLSKFDPITNDVLNVLTRRPGPPNHWTEAWINVELGCAYAAAGNSQQAVAALGRGILVNGEFDHPLTSTALLELGRLSLESGDFAAAGKYFEEATYASFVFLNLGNLEEAFRLGLLAHLLLNQKSPYPLLSPAIAWAKSQGLRELQSSLLVLAAENMAVLGDVDSAANLLAQARSIMPRSDLAISRIGARLNHVAALVSYQSGNVSAGDQSLTAALGFQRGASPWTFQIAVADARYTGGDISDRVGLALYEMLLRDPAPADWAYSPLDCLALLTSAHGTVYEHWFEAALNGGKEQELALEIADRARRHRFYSTLPLGGRLLSLRWLLTGPTHILGERGALERQELLGRYPQYQKLADDASMIREKLAARPVVAEKPDDRQAQTALLASLADIGQKQELLLRQMSVRRDPADMVFPPQRKTVDVQKALPDGQVMLAFFAAGRNLYAFLYSNEKYASWRIQSPLQLQKQISTLLRELGNFEQNHELTHNELTKTNWRAAADKVEQLLLDKSNVELAGNFDEIVIVPDGILWYLPFEVLSAGKSEQKKLLISQARVRYAPTVGLAVPYSLNRKPRPNTGVVLGKIFPHGGDTTEAFEELGRAVPGSVALPRALPSSSAVFRTVLDGLIVLDDVEAGEGPYDWSPVQIDRGRPGSSLESWLSLPWGGPDHVILPAFHTLAESGMRKTTAAGNDLFLSLCGLMSSGVRTVLISRWRTGGQTSIDLVREFAQELPHAGPAEAWQRSVQISLDTALEPDREPRIKKGTLGSESLKANHPFFWSGYMLVDTGTAADEQHLAPAGVALQAAPKADGAPRLGQPQPPAAGGQPAQPAGGGQPGQPAGAGAGLLVPGVGQGNLDMPADAAGPDKREKRSKAPRAGKKAPVKAPKPAAS